MLWIKEVEIGRFGGRFINHRAQFQGYTQFPNFEMLDARIASALNKIIQNSHFKKKVSLEEQESSERKSVLSRKTDRSHDLRLLPGYWRS